MSVRFDNSADSLSRANNDLLVSNPSANLSGCLWVKRKVDTGAFATVFFFDQTSKSTIFIETETGGDVLHYFEDPTTTDLTGPTLTIDTWFFLGWVRTNTSQALYYGTEAGGTLTKVSATDTRTVSGETSIQCYIGNDIYTEPFNGEIAYVRLWETNLSDAEMDSEWRSTTPVKTASLRGDWRLAAAASATTDSSGNGLTLTTGGTLSDGADDPTPPSASSSSVSPSISPSASASFSLSPSASLSPSSSASPSASPSQGYTGYSRGDEVALPANDNDLETAYTGGDVTTVSVSNNTRVDQTATGQYMIHQYKNFVGGNTSCNLSWEGQTTLAPSTSAVVLQIYNQNTTTWENVDSNNSASVGTDFTLSGTIADLSNYKTAQNTISCRIYQANT